MHPLSRSLQVAVASSCIISGYCRNTAPDIFQPGANHKSTVTENPVEESAALWEAMEGCPVEAISAIELATGTVVFPEA
jgi:ferredoxin